MKHNHNHVPDTHNAMLKDLKIRFIISTIATIPTLLLSKLTQELFSISISFTGDDFFLMALASFIYIYGGWPFLKGFVIEIRQKKMGMMTLVALSITASYLYSVAVASQIMDGKIFFWEVATLIDVMLLGHLIEMKSTLGASKSLKKLIKLLPSEVEIIQKDGSTSSIPQSELKIGDHALIKPGEKIPSDGVIIDGSANIDLSMVTGESKPAHKGKNDFVIGGSVNQDGSLVVEITKTGKDSYLSKVTDLVREANESKSKAQTIADKAASALTIISIVAGVSTLLFWLYHGHKLSFALENKITVMIISCPHALGLAIPLVISSITYLAAGAGLLIKNRSAFERAYKCDTILFDKTGTLTTGVFGVTKVVSISDWNDDKIIKTAAAIERKSEHNIAKAIVINAKDKPIPQVANFKSIAGLGASAFVEKEVIYVGSPEMISGKSNTSRAQEEIKKLEKTGKTVVVITNNEEVKGLIALSDKIRPESLEACKKLRSKKFKLAIITGDNETVANNVADQLGITKVFSSVLPEQKVSIVKSLQKSGHHVIMVGDGINDSPALAQADVGVAIASGTDIAAETSDVILVGSDPRDIVNIVRLSKTMRRKVLQNLVWATGYNIIAIPIASGIFSKYGLSIPPALGAIVMTLSTLIVTINSQLIKVKK